MVGKFNFSGHGASVKGANKGPLYTEPKVSIAIKVKDPGTLMAMSLCNIHGLWESMRDLNIA